MGYRFNPDYRNKRFPDSARTPEEKPKCSLFARCEGCPYPNHGFVCWNQDGQCMREIMKKLSEGVDSDGDKRSTE